MEVKSDTKVDAEIALSIGGEVTEFLMSSNKPRRYSALILEATEEKYPNLYKFIQGVKSTVQPVKLQQQPSHQPSQQPLQQLLPFEGSSETPLQGWRYSLNKWYRIVDRLEYGDKMSFSNRSGVTCNHDAISARILTNIIEQAIGEHKLIQSLNDMGRAGLMNIVS